MKKFKLYIFDLDGTVADTLEAIAHTCNQALSEFGFPEQPEERYRFFAGDAVGKLIERALISAGDRVDKNGFPIHYSELLERYMALFERGCTYNVRAFDGMRDTLDKIKLGGGKIAVLSNKRHKYAVEVTEYIYGKDYFDIVVGEGFGFLRKPSPEGAVYICKRLGIAPGECAYIGDTNTDMITGKAAGMYTIGVLWGLRERDELLQNGADCIVSRPEELIFTEDNI